MELLAEATAFDVLVLFLFLAFLVRGIWIGFIRQISSLLAMLVGFFLAGYFDNDFYTVLLPYFKSSHTVFLLSYIILFIAFLFIYLSIWLSNLYKSFLIPFPRRRNTFHPEDLPHPSHPGNYRLAVPVVRICYK